jgi:vinculin
MIHLNLKAGKKTEEASENRNYLTTRMTDEINEIIRVLQLTTSDDEDWDADNLASVRRAIVRVFYVLISTFD